MASCDWLLSPSIPFARFTGSQRAWVLRSFFLLRASPSAARADHVSLTDHRLVDVWVRLLRCSRGSPWGGSRFSVYHDRCHREHSPTRLRVDVSSLLRGLYTCKRNCGVICRSVLHGLRTRQTFPQQLHRFRRQRLSASAPALGPSGRGRPGGGEVVVGAPAPDSRCRASLRALICTASSRNVC